MVSRIEMWPAVHQEDLDVENIRFGGKVGGDSPKRSNNNKTKAGSFDCTIELKTQLPLGDKTRQRYDALSLVIIELFRNPSYEQDMYR